ncbi:Glucose-1-phosphate adenylyltransferase large subunit 1, chloroplastic [Dendrobium catenatum]|uniref:glucose-1-phosphate adenylyltransferase n=1 Tax=Dendrobium catenatum TaxID=906689 RepID=A0A2I0WP38_9ASPA|nr:Glucose-1-phosphate adenylyltransferase large subunit 1, chloroplastic [Dendrobium catenatum]
MGSREYNEGFVSRIDEIRVFESQRGPTQSATPTLPPVRPRVYSLIQKEDRNASGESIVLVQLRDLELERRDPRTVVAVILGGGAGTRLFPLTRQRAKPAVSIGGAYRLIDIPMSNCINSRINKVYILTQFNSASLNRHLSRAYNFSNGISFGDGFVEVLAATQTSGEAGKRWFQGTADAVRQFHWLFEIPALETAKNCGLELLYPSCSGRKCQEGVWLVPRRKKKIVPKFPSCIGLKSHYSKALVFNITLRLASICSIALVSFAWPILAVYIPSAHWLLSCFLNLLLLHSPSSLILDLVIDAKGKEIEDVLILSGDHLYRMDYMDFVQSHRQSGADITISCVPMDDSRASDFGLMKIDNKGRVIAFSEKPKGEDLKAMEVDTSVLGLSREQAKKNPYIASMGVYVFKKEILLNLLRWRFPTANDFGSEIIPASAKEQFVKIAWFLNVFNLSNMKMSAYLFNDYWEDIGTLKSFFEANLSLTRDIVDSIVSHGSFLSDCLIEHSIIGIRSRINSNVHLKDTVMLGADFYETEAEVAALLAEGRVPVGIGENTKIRRSDVGTDTFDLHRRIGDGRSSEKKRRSVFGEEATVGTFSIEEYATVARRRTRKSGKKKAQEQERAGIATNGIASDRVLTLR